MLDRIGRAAIILLVLLASSTRASATSEFTGNDMVEPCRASAKMSPNGMPSALEALNEGVCLGFFVGISAIRPSLRPVGICIPDEVNAGQMVKVAVQYFDRNPVKLDERFIDLALDALAAAWPCHST